MSTLFLDTESDGLDWGCKAYMLAYTASETDAPKVIDWRKIKLDFSRYNHFVGANTYFDTRMLGIDNPPKCDDVLVAFYCMTGKWRGLKDIAVLLGIGSKQEQDEVINAMRQLPKFKRATFERCITHAWMVWDVTAKYCADDVRLTRQLYQKFLPSGVFDDPNYLRMIEAERNAFEQTVKGVKVGIGRACSYTETMAKRDREIRDSVKAAYDISVSSPTQVTRSLGTKNSDAKTLERMAEENELAAYALEFRGIQAALKVLLGELKVERVHPRISWHCVTGRASTSAPNLQGLAGKLLAGVNVRSLIEPDNDDEVILSCDFSQIEYRIFAAQSQDSQLLKAFRDGIDVHDQMQNTLFANLSSTEKRNMLRESCVKSAVEFPETFKESLNFARDEHRLGAGYIRKQSKRAVFATMYGSSVGGLIANGYDHKVSRAIYNYFSEIKRNEWYEDLRFNWQKTGIVTTMWGRPIFSDSEHKILNYRTQGTAADTMQEFSNDLTKYFARTNQGRLLFTIHDECVTATKEKNVERVTAWIKNNVSKIKFDFGYGEAVPLGVEVKVFPNRQWGIK